MNVKKHQEIMDTSIQTAVVFQTYSVMLNLMNRTLIMLAERGADQRTLSFLVKNINTLIENINEYAGDLAIEKKWNQDLNEICTRFQITRANENKDDKASGAI